MQIVTEKDYVDKEIQDADTKKRFKEIEKIMLLFLYNLSKSNKVYIHWTNEGLIIKGQIDKLMKLDEGGNMLEIKAHHKELKGFIE